jgi:glycosyltransferase involved in cell wall biosynthesis
MCQNNRPSMNMIFHHTSPIDSNASVGSAVRPLQMVRAFEALGYSIDFATGYIQERKKRMREIKKKIRSGKRYDFVYAENSNLPNSVSPTERVPIHFLMDYSFFRTCNKHDIPIGLFYRDIYWAFGIFGKTRNPFLQRLAKTLYRYDLRIYSKTLKKMYLPSEKVGEFVPIVDSALFKALPPGGTFSINPSSKILSEKGMLRLFYVGGFGGDYDMHVLFEVVSRMPNVELTICTREHEWKLHEAEYPIPSSNISIVHLFGSKMEESLLKHDIALLYVQPIPYREIAMPIKLFEYIGLNKPIIASKGTLAADFVSEHGLGWAVDYDAESLEALLNNLATTPKMIDDAVERIAGIKDQHTWKARALQVVSDLTT